MNGSISGKIVKIMLFLYLISHTFLSTISAQTIKRTLYTEYCTIGRQLFYNIWFAKTLITIICFANLLNDKISLQIAFQLRNITLFDILRPRSINFFIFFSKNAGKLQKFNIRYMQTTPNYPLLIVQANFHLIKLCCSLHYSEHRTFFLQSYPILPIFAPFCPFFIKKYKKCRYKLSVNNS